ncbi:hypothetical protein [Haloarcula argentinensis]|uniref:rRNA maturation RNase YbeY n=1 Tax=Haloarcula argentinensis TaxID=43776 RepID=A0ABU2F618_HALAR|nr:hypothetical protein [Haloarcula argentinensis]MDS0256023.1 hypothetical protein [Haloarcula argentinensis]
MADERNRQKDVPAPEFAPGETVSVTVEFESAFWARLALEVEQSDHDSVASWIRWAAWSGLPENSALFDTETADCEVELDPVEWERIRLAVAARLQMDPDREPSFVFHDILTQFVDSRPVPVVGGERKGLSDIFTGNR